MPPQHSPAPSLAADCVPVPIPPHRRELVRRAIAQGRVMTYATETSYALGGNALDANLVQAIYRIKGRDPGKPLLLLVEGRRGVEEWVGAVAPAARLLMARFWPGPLTLVFAAGPQVPAHLLNSKGTIALRWSPHPAVAELLDLGGVPLIGTSANASGAPSLHTARAVLEAFPGESILAMDGGTAPGGAPSTVLDATLRPFRIVRPGAVSAVALRTALADAPEFAPPDAG